MQGAVAIAVAAAAVAPAQQQQEQQQEKQQQQQQQASGGGVNPYGGETGCDEWLDGRRCAPARCPSDTADDRDACAVKCAAEGADGCCLYDNGRCKFYVGKHVLDIEGDAPGRSAAQCHDDGSDKQQQQQQQQEESRGRWAAARSPAGSCA